MSALGWMVCNAILPYPLNPCLTQGRHVGQLVWITLPACFRTPVWNTDVDKHLCRSQELILVWFCHLLPYWYWHLTSLNLSFPHCKVMQFEDWVKQPLGILPQHQPPLLMQSANCHSVPVSSVPGTLKGRRGNTKSSLICIPTRALRASRVLTKGSRNWVTIQLHLPETARAVYDVLVGLVTTVVSLLNVVLLCIRDHLVSAVRKKLQRGVSVRTGSLWDATAGVCQHWYSRALMGQLLADRLGSQAFQEDPPEPAPDWRRLH